MQGVSIIQLLLALTGSDSMAYNKQVRLHIYAIARTEWGIMQWWLLSVQKKWQEAMVTRDPI